jgi:hypothetical protein
LNKSFLTKREGGGQTPQPEAAKSLAAGKKALLWHVVQRKKCFFSIFG